MLKMDLEYEGGILFIRLKGMLNRRNNHKINNYLVPILVVIVTISFSLILTKVLDIINSKKTIKCIIFKKL